MTPHTILIVEDEAIVAMDIQDTLISLGYRTGGPLATGEEAIHAASHDRPSLILMDIMLDGEIDGIEAATRIREETGLPVVFLTSHADQSTLTRAKVTEPYGYILKPFNENELRTVVELALYRHEMDQQRAVRATGAHSSAGGGTLDSFLAHAEKRTTSAAELKRIVDAFAEMEPFQSLSPAQLEKIACTSYFEHFKAGEHLILEGDERSNPYIITQGRVAIVKSSSNGKDLIVEVVTRGDTFGLLSALGTGATPFSSKAQIDTAVIWMPAQIIASILEQHTEYSRSLISHMLNRLRKSHDLSRALAHDRVEIRVASALLALLPPPEANGQMELRLSRQELAEMTGTAPETASRVANAFERDGLVDLSKSGIVRILDRSRLSGMLELQ